MAETKEVPVEHLNSIVEHLCDRRIVFFDPVVTTDLQNLRLTSKQVFRLLQLVASST